MPVLRPEMLPMTHRTAQREALGTLTVQLVAEFAGLLPAGSVIRCVGRCRESLAGMGVQAGLVLAVEGMARGLLLQRLPRAS